MLVWLENPNTDFSQMCTFYVTLNIHKPFIPIEQTINLTKHKASWNSKFHRDYGPMNEYNG